MTNIAAFLRQNWILAGFFLGACLLALWFAVHVVMDALYFNDPRNVDVDLKPWMTPRYVVMTYDLPRSVVAELLELDGPDDRGLRLGRIAESRGISMDALIALVREAAAEYRALPEWLQLSWPLFRTTACI